MHIFAETIYDGTSLLFSLLNSNDILKVTTILHAINIRDTLVTINNATATFL